MSAGSGSESAAMVPAEFDPMPQGLGFIDAIQPVYRRVQDAQASFGLIIDKQHTNTMGICHGGVLMMLADMTAASGVNLARGEVAGNPTINLNIDFIAAAKHGEWLQADSEEVSLKRRFGFCRGTLHTARGVVARFSGTFYFPDHDGMWKDGKKTASALFRDNS